MSSFPQSMTRALINVWLSLVFFSLASCGNGNMVGNGTGNPGTALGALQIANTDIAHGNYNGAISVLAPYCPNNNCVNPDIANAFANAYIALGNGTSGSGGATITQILSQVLNLVNTNASATQVLQGVNQAIPCLASNSCKTAYLDNLATALQTLANTSCSGSTTTASNCPDSSSILLASAVYLLVVAQYEAGIVYTGGTWFLCTPNGGGLLGCALLSESTLAKDLFANPVLLQNILAILGATCSGCSGKPHDFRHLDDCPQCSSLLSGLPGIDQHQYCHLLQPVSQCHQQLHHEPKLKLCLQSLRHHPLQRDPERLRVGLVPEPAVRPKVRSLRFRRDYQTLMQPLSKDRR